MTQRWPAAQAKPALALGVCTPWSNPTRWIDHNGFAILQATLTAMADLNVLGTPLVPCSYDPLTGFFRDGCCSTHEVDHGKHVVCAQVTQSFLDYSLARGNDLTTPRPEHRFAGLKPGDRWCLCAQRWREALHANVAPPVFLRCTHHSALKVVALEQLQAHALDGATTP